VRATAASMSRRQWHLVGPRHSWVVTRYSIGAAAYRLGRRLNQL
jgi:hypothetical protein